MNKKIDDLNKTIDWHEQYFRRKFILVHGKESENEDTDVIVKEILNEFLQEKFANVDIDRSHQIGTIKISNNQGPSSSSLPGITSETEYLKTRKN